MGAGVKGIGIAICARTAVIEAKKAIIESSLADNVDFPFLFPILVFLLVNLNYYTVKHKTLSTYTLNGVDNSLITEPANRDSGIKWMQESKLKKDLLSTISFHALRHLESRLARMRRNGLLGGIYSEISTS